MVSPSNNLTSLKLPKRRHSTNFS